MLDPISPSKYAAFLDSPLPPNSLKENSRILKITEAIIGTQ